MTGNDPPMDERLRLLQVPAPGLPKRLRLEPRRPKLYLVPSLALIKSSLADINTRADSLTGDDTHSVNFDENMDKFYRLLSQRVNRWAYVAYYLPILRWFPNYSISNNLLGDLVAGLSLASFQIPLVMSFATSLARLPAVLGLYTIIIGSLVYPIFGTVPILVVGPSPLSAIIYGQTIEQMHHIMSEKLDLMVISSALTAILGAVLFGCGLFRFGFLDKMFSRALLKGFIAAMGVIMIVNQLPVELGLEEEMAKHPHVTTLDKIWFLATHLDLSHKLTTYISILTFIIVYAVKKAKPLIRCAVYFPELLLMVVLATLACYHFLWPSRGVEVVGDVTVDHVALHNPFTLSRFSLYKKVFSTAFLVTLLGFFDSATAIRSLDAKYNFNVSSNRELLALGAVNVVNSVFAGLPAFGAFGRSKINAQAGALTPMSGIFMALATIFVVVYMLQYFFFLPQCVLALTTTIIGVTVLEEMPQDIMFFCRTQGYDELVTFALVFMITLLWLAEAGVFTGIGVAVVRVIKQGTQSRIQIMGRIPGTVAFRNADELIEESFNHATTPETLPDLVAEIEQIEGTLIVKIPEPLNFANSSDLKAKFLRLEKYGSLLIHPSQPQAISTPKRIVFDCKGMTKIDTGAVQILREICERATHEGSTVCFSRVPLIPLVRDKLRRSGIVTLVNGNIRSDQETLGLGLGFYMSIDDAVRALEGDV